MRRANRFTIVSLTLLLLMCLGEIYLYNRQVAEQQFTSMKLLHANKLDQPQAILQIDNSNRYTVVIDAGHSGENFGAESVHNRLEKDFNLATALKVAELASHEKQLQMAIRYTPWEELHLRSIIERFDMEPLRA